MKKIWFDIKKFGCEWNSFTDDDLKYIGPAIEITNYTYNDIFFTFLENSVINEESNVVCFLCGVTENTLKTVEINLDTKTARGYIDTIPIYTYNYIMEYMEKVDENNVA